MAHPDAFSLGAHPDPRLVAVLRAMRGIVDLAIPEADLSAWVHEAQAGGQEALAARADLAPVSADPPRSSWADLLWIVGAFGLPVLGGVLFTQTCFRGPGGCDGGTCVVCYFFGVGGVLAGVVLAIAVALGLAIFRKDPVSDRRRQWNVTARGEALRPEDRGPVVERVLAGADLEEVAQAYGISTKTLEQWAHVFLDGAAHRLKDRFGVSP